MAVMVNQRAALAMLVVVVLIGAMAFTLDTVSQASDAQQSDLSALSWVDAFNRLHARMAREYAFTDWKGINWQGLHEKYLAKMQAAQATSDFAAYYVALRGYLQQIPDGHVGVNNLREIDDQYIGGGFGLATAQIDDGRIIITWVDEEGPAWASGLRAGAELVEWNGQPAARAVAAVSTVFASNPATTEYLESRKPHYLVRAPIGQTVSLTFLNQGSPEPQSASLTAYDDGRKSLTKSYPDAVISDKLRDLIQEVDSPDPIPEAMIEKKTLSGNISYIRIWGELDADLQLTGQAPSTLELWRQALREVIASQSTGLIVDLRNNVGGLDDMAADILGSFWPQTALYEYQNVYNPATGQREIAPVEARDGASALTIEPAPQVYEGRVIALINPKCISSGEGIANGIRNLQYGDTLGFYGTNGSFGLSGPAAAMPGGLTVRWPSGQSLDMDQEIQLDSREGIGGVSPSIRISMSFANALRIANGVDVELEEAVRILGR